MFNIPFNMKKVSIRQMIHGFAKLNDSLKPGETVDITNHGEPIGQYTKRPARRARAKMPNFYQEARKDGYGPKVGDELAKRILADDETVS